MNIIIVVHTFQAFLLCIMLLNRRFRSLPNTLLTIILAGVVIFNFLNYLILNDLITERIRLMFSFIYILPPPLIYTYWYTYIYGETPPKRTINLHLLPIMILLIVTLLTAFTGKAIKFSLTFMGEITVLYHLIYPFFMLRLLKSFYGIKKKGIGNALIFNSEKTSILKIFILMMIFHSLLFFMQYNFTLIFPSFIQLHTFIQLQLFFMIILQYLITWVIICMPTVIHFTDKKIGLASFKNYKCSSLSCNEAKDIARKLNVHMELTKSYQNPLYSVQDMCKDVEIDYLDVSESLNGLMGQSFNDYINNYRIEEVKRFFKDPNYKKESILSIAFSSGFNSKATFYSAFKKFTGETPSQCRKRLSTDIQNNKMS